MVPVFIWLQSIYSINPIQTEGILSLAWASAAWLANITPELSKGRFGEGGGLNLWQIVMNCGPSPVL